MKLATAGAVMAIVALAGCGDGAVKPTVDELKQAGAKAAVRVAAEAVAAGVKGELDEGRLSVETASKLLSPYKDIVEARILDADSDGFVDGGVELRVRDAVVCVLLGPEGADVVSGSCPSGQ